VETLRGNLLRMLAKMESEREAAGILRSRAFDVLLEGRGRYGKVEMKRRSFSYVKIRSNNRSKGEKPVI
jgi:hypothetical protein